MAYRLGIVKEQDLQNARVRVVFQDHQQMLSYWLEVLARKTQNDKFYAMPDIGEQVACLMDEHDEAGCVLGAVFSAVDTTPVQSADKDHAGYKDGATFEYDRETHTWNVGLPSGATMNITANEATIAIDASGNITVHAAGGISLITSSHTDSVDDIIDTFNSHVHAGVQPGSGNTAPPTAQMP